MTVRFNPGREDDDRLLGMVASRARGMSCPSLARRFGVSAHAVMMATNRVMKADLAESGERPSVVQQWYWRQT